VKRNRLSAFQTCSLLLTVCNSRFFNLDSSQEIKFRAVFAQKKEPTARVGVTLVNSFWRSSSFGKKSAFLSLEIFFHILSRNPLISFNPSISIKIFQTLVNDIKLLITELVKLNYELL